MKLLVLALDGGDADIIRAMDMPFTQKLLEERTMMPVEEDLWSRGWGEIASGKHALDNGAFYEKPKLDGTCNFSQSYKLSDYHKVPDSKLLWEKINELGYKVGFINLPTTVPAPKVDGFFISGAGSGFSPASRIPEAACYPPEIAYELLKRNYIWEQRFRVSGITHLDFFIDKCIEAVRHRTEIFIELSQKHRVDMGFVMHKEFTIVANLFMYSIQLLLEGERLPGGAVQRRVSSFYRVLDDFLRVIVTELSPDHVMLVSDHAAAPYRYSLNLNDFLVQTGFASVDKSHRTPRISGRQRLLRLLQKKISPDFFDPERDGWHTTVVDYSGSTAFANRYVPGIYLNDERFSGVVVEPQEKQKTVAQLVDKFNARPEAREHNMRARPYRQEHRDRFAESWLPDVWIDLPEHVYPEQKGGFVQKNPFWRPYDNLQYAHQDVLTGLKGRNALCSVERELAAGLDLDKKYDLTVAHQLIVRHFSEK